ncbi:uncharacterized protein DS421_3g78110 [Arachis hypogaea]|nr:uncharacterized protein DS421_3g78110 [Arachis hypogaea]
MLLKIGPDQSVQPEKSGTGYLTGPDNMKNRLAKNWSNQRFTGESEEPFDFLACIRRQPPFTHKGHECHPQPLTVAATTTGRARLLVAESHLARLLIRHPQPSTTAATTTGRAPLLIAERHLARLLIRHPQPSIAAASTTGRARLLIRR